MATHATRADGAQSERNPNDFDVDGWRIPMPPWPSSSSHSPAERQSQSYLVDALKRSGWFVSEYPRAYDRDGNRYVPDLLVEYPGMLDEPGAIEVKADIKTVREFTDAAKQAIDYTSCKVLATGRRISWAAIYPFCPERDADAAMMLGALAFSGVAFKCGAFIDGSDANLMGLQGSDGRNDLLLIYKREQRIWSLARGFVADARNMLLGKRRIGGQRLCRRI